MAAPLWEGACPARGALGEVVSTQEGAWVRWGPIQGLEVWGWLSAMLHDTSVCEAAKHPRRGKHLPRLPFICLLFCCTVHFPPSNFASTFLQRHFIYWLRLLLGIL